MKKETLELQLSKDKCAKFPCPTTGSHYKIELHDLNDWNMSDTVHLIQEETVLISEEKKRNLVSPATIKKIHEVTNHKNANNLL